MDLGAVDGYRNVPLTVTKRCSSCLYYPSSRCEGEGCGESIEVVVRQRLEGGSPSEVIEEKKSPDEVYRSCNDLVLPHYVVTRYDRLV